MIRRLTIVCVCAMACLMALGVKPENTRGRGKSRVDQSRIRTTTVVYRPVSEGEITIAGYDKPLRANSETMLITNHTDQTVDTVALTLRYNDTAGRMLHQRGVKVGGPFPAGQTRQAKIRTWDVQGSYVYVNSAKPRRQHTPYLVMIAVDSVASESAGHGVAPGR